MAAQRPEARPDGLLIQTLPVCALIPRASTPCQFFLKDEAALARKASGCPKVFSACPAPPRADRPLRRTRVRLDSTLHQLCCSPRACGPVRAVSARRYVPSTTVRGRFSHWHYKRFEPQAGMARHDCQRCDSPIDVGKGRAPHRCWLAGSQLVCARLISRFHWRVAASRRIGASMEFCSEETRAGTFLTLCR